MDAGRDLLFLDGCSSWHLRLLFNKISIDFESDTWMASNMCLDNTTSIQSMGAKFPPILELCKHPDEFLLWLDTASLDLPVCEPSFPEKGKQ